MVSGVARGPQIQFYNAVLTIESQSKNPFAQKIEFAVMLMAAWLFCGVYYLLSLASVTCVTLFSDQGLGDLLVTFGRVDVPVIKNHKTLNGH